MASGTQRPPRRRRTPEAARQEILDAATALFAARGFDAVTLHDIARAVGVSHALVLHYFESFDGVVRAVLGARNATVAREVLARVTDHDTPLAPGELLARVLAAMRDSTHGRLFAWALLTGRALKGNGLARVADAVEARLAADAARCGGPAPSRARVEAALTLGLCAVVGNVVGGDAFARSFGHEPGEARDRFDASLAALLTAALRSDAR